MKSKFFLTLKLAFPSLVVRIQRKLITHKRGWIMGRMACMGKDVLKLLNINAPLVNVQKGRVDYLNSIFKDPKLKTRAKRVCPHIKRNDIKELIIQQKILWEGSSKAPLAFFMDSFSELTDQRFYHKKQGWSFSANYSDIEHSANFMNTFESKGLLSVDDLIDSYRVFFDSIRQMYGQIPIIFMHFPVKLDERKKFKSRYKRIKEAIDQVKMEFQPFYSFEVNEEIVDWPKESSPELKSFPYHYNRETYQNLAKQIVKSDALSNVLK